MLTMAPTLTVVATLKLSESDLRVLAFFTHHGQRMVELLAERETFDFNRNMIRSFLDRVGPEVRAALLRIEATQKNVDGQLS